MVNGSPKNVMFIWYYYYIDCIFNPFSKESVFYQCRWWTVQLYSKQRFGNNVNTHTAEDPSCDLWGMGPSLFLVHRMMGKICVTVLH